ncbi:OLC1v1001744C1 [Oldenlandia corymbosa var. corymbosa]|uniref:OLC1v1001744C1 n=1 Tax=Oldenlandia corymbosa var. corymbosa TaxID=529605 RepID=A0AAV1D8S8_OLDCO|nr:OLC1v1001744C1 [Oldenlandia corymbosa var. corymbosa]
MESMGLICSLLMFLLIGMNLCSCSRLSQFDQSTTPVKSIETSDGDVIDCVPSDISNQPAFDHHPLINNNDIQKRPFSVKKSITQSWHLDGSCPKGTIAVKRTTQEETTRANSMKRFRINSVQESNFQAASDTDTSSTSSGFEQSAAMYVDEGNYYGAMATMNVWNLKVRPNEFSSSAIWVVGGSGSDQNMIIAGWHGDNFNSTGCYNLYCTGFVQTSNKFALGAPFPTLSTIDGVQAEFDVIIYKGQFGWNLQLNDFILGYWPFSLFTNLKSKASWVAWGGLVFNSQIDGKQSTTTQMGSGHFPEEGIKRASYMRHLQVFNETLYSRRLDSPKLLTATANCYNATFANNELMGDFILYGGPGRNPNCP